MSIESVMPSNHLILCRPPLLFPSIFPSIRVFSHPRGGLVTKSCLTLVTPWTAAYQAPLSMGLLWKEYWRRLPLPPSGDLPNPGTEPTSPVAPALAGRLSLSHLASPRIKFMSPALPGRFLTTAPPGKVLWWRRVGGIFKTSILSLSEKCKAKPQ